MAKTEEATEPKVASPERVAAFRTGISAETIRRIARDFAAAKHPVAYGRVGLSTQSFGGLCQWLVNALNAITGNLDEPGGMMWPRPAFDLLQQAKAGETHAGRWRSRVRNLPEFDGEFPVATMAEEMLMPGPGQVRALVTCAGGEPVRFARRSGLAGQGGGPRLLSGRRPVQYSPENKSLSGPVSLPPRRDFTSAMKSS